MSLEAQAFQGPVIAHVPPDLVVVAAATQLDEAVVDDQSSMLQMACIQSGAICSGFSSPNVCSIFVGAKKQVNRR